MAFKRTARVIFRGYAGQKYQQMLDRTNTDYSLIKRIENWYVVYEFTIGMGVVYEEHCPWTPEEILAREG